MQILRWARAGIIPGTHLTKGGHFRFEESPDLKAWVRKNSKPPRSELWRKPHNKRKLREGDVRLTPIFHHQSIVNRFNNWRHRADLGLITINQAAFARDMRPMYDWLKKFYGD